LTEFSQFKNGNDPKGNQTSGCDQKKSDGLEKVQENLWVLYPDELIESINWISSQAIFTFLNKRNNRIFAGSIARAAAKLGFRDYIHFNDNDMFRSFT
jgi:hypothetical protein